MSDTGEKKPGKVLAITSTANPLVKHIKSLALKKNRDEESLFMAEGMKLVTEAVDSGWNIRTLVYASAQAQNTHLQQIAAKAKAAGAYVLEVNEKVLSSISRKDNPQMVIGVFEQKWHKPDTIGELATMPGDVLLALDRVRDPGNLGTIIRTAEACGVKAMVLVGESTDPYSLEAVRASMGSLFNLPMAKMSQSAFLGWRDSTSAKWVGTHLEGAVDYRTITWSDLPTLLVMGNEQQGLTPEIAAACDELALIPMAGKADSLNLAIATGVMLFEIRRDQLAMPEKSRNGDLSFNDPTGN